MDVNKVERRVTREPYVSREEYSKLIRAYKEYDAKQKSIINQAYSDINKLSKKIEKLEKELSEYKEIIGNSTAQSVRQRLDGYTEMKNSRNHYKRVSMIAEQAWLAATYPEYEWTDITEEKRKAILEILSAGYEQEKVQEEAS